MVSSEQHNALELGFRMGNWRVKPLAGELRASRIFSLYPASSADKKRHVEPKAMRVLLALAARQGEFVSKDALIQQVWDGRPVSDDVLTGAIHSLRAALDDDPRDPKFIETRSNVGYRLLTVVRPNSRGGRAQLVKGAGMAATLVIMLTTAVLVYTRHTESTKQLTTIAVLPFMNNSESPGADYLSDAMTEALILNLSRLPDIRVISRTSVMPFAKQQGSAASIAKQLDADLLVEGSVQAVDGRLRVVAQLIEPFEEGHLWADHFDRSMDDVLALQHEVSGTIAAQIGSIVVESPPAVLASLPSSSMEDYLQARYLLAREDIASAESALKLFESLSGRHPDFAPAYLGQAQSLLYLFKAHERESDALKTALDAGLQFESLAGASSESNRCIGQLLLLSEWNFDAAERRYESAIAINPSDTVAHRRYAWLLVALQRYEEAATEIHQIQLWNPLYYESSEMAALLLFSGQVDASVKEFERLDRTSDLGTRALRAMAMAYLAAGRDHDAQQALVRMLVSAGLVDNEQESQLRKADTEELYRYIIEVKPFKSLIVTAGFHNLIGNPDAAIQNLRQATVDRDPFILYIGALPELAGLHDDPRFLDLLTEIGVFPQNQDHLRETRLFSANPNNPQVDPQEN